MKIFKKIFADITLGKIIGMIAFIITEVIIFILLSVLDKKDVLAIGYIQLSVFAITWGAVGYKNYSKNLIKNKNDLTNKV